MSTNLTEKYFLFILLLLTLVLTLIILYPFLTVLILAAAFAVVLNPVYSFINRRIVRNISWLASLLTVILFILVLCIPLFFLGKAIFNETQDVYNYVMSKGSSNYFIDYIDQAINRWLPSGFNFDVHTKITQMFSSLTNNLAGFFTATLNSILMFTLMVFSMFYILKDGDGWRNEFVKILPLSDENSNWILNDLKKSTNRIFKGSFIIAIAQGLLAWAGFTIFGVPNAAIWAVIAGVASFVPTIGTSLVSIPAVLFLFFTGMELQALGLLIWSAVIIGTVDNILNPYIISKDSGIPSLFILFSILGGVSVLGPLGILIGPLILSLLYSLISIYKKQELKN